MEGKVRGCVPQARCDQESLARCHVRPLRGGECAVAGWGVVHPSDELRYRGSWPPLFEGLKFEPSSIYMSCVFQRPVEA